VNDTFYGNAASTAGGAFHICRGCDVWAVNATFSANRAPSTPILHHQGLYGLPYGNAYFVNNIFSSNVATSASASCQYPLIGLDNVTWPAPLKNPAPEAACAQGTIALDPQLGPLADHGGGLLTMPVPATNPAASMADSNCPQTDARGVKRGSPCAVGAFEPEK